MVKSKYASLWSGIAEEELIAHKLEALMANNKIPETVTIENFIHGSATDDYFHPSMHTAMHEIQLYFQFHPDFKDKLIKRTRHYVDIITPYMGTTVHAIVQQTFIHNGLVPAEDIEVTLTNEEHHWTGHMDLIYKGIPIDIKTMNPRMFAKVTEPYEKYKQQLQCYMDMYPDAPYGILLIFELGYPFRVKEFKVERDAVMLDKIYTKWDNVREAIAMNQIPGHCCTELGDKAEKCSARDICASLFDVKVDEGVVPEWTL